MIKTNRCRSLLNILLGCFKIINFSGPSRFFRTLDRRPIPGRPWQSCIVFECRYSSTLSIWATIKMLYRNISINFIQIPQSKFIHKGFFFVFWFLQEMLCFIQCFIRWRAFWFRGNLVSKWWFYLPCKYILKSIFFFFFTYLPCTGYSAVSFETFVYLYAQ